MNVVLYIRTSTKKQNIREQINSLTTVCNNNGWTIVNTFMDEGISGLNNNRQGLNDMVTYLNNNTVDRVVITETSRLGRNIENTKTLIDNITIPIYINDINKHITSYKDIPNEILYSNKESKKIRDRMKRGYDTYRDNGGTVGRKVGYKPTNEELVLRHQDIIICLNKGYSIRKTMRECNKASGTVQKIKKLIKYLEEYEIDTTR